MKRKRYTYFCIVALILSAAAGVSVNADNESSGTEISVSIPDSHTLNLQISGNGKIMIDGTEYSAASTPQTVSIDRLKKQTYEIKLHGTRLKKLLYNGQDVTNKVEQDCYTAPPIYEDASLEAEFIDNASPVSYYTIEASSGGNGSISPSGSVSVREYTSQTFTFSPDNGYKIGKVLADGKEVGALSSYTFENVTSNHTISVTFVQKIPDTYPDGTVEKPDGSFITPDGVVILPDGSIVLNDGTKLDPDSSGNAPQVNKDGTVTAADDSVRSPDGSYIRPAKSIILNASATGNRVAVTLKEQTAGAYGYDYVIGKSPDMLKTKDYHKVNKNRLSLDTSFYYLNKGTYYAACHAWFRDSNGRKVFGSWSEVEKLTVSAVTPKTPRITKVKVKGSTVTVTYTKCSGATGYDVILGKSARKVNGELRPVNYGKLVKKITKKNTVTVTFKNVPNGTYYAGLHAYNRTSEDNKKVFSPWSDVRKVKVASL